MFNPFMLTIAKWPNVFQKSCGVETARFLKYVWPFCNTMHERVKTFHVERKFQDIITQTSKHEYNKNDKMLRNQRAKIIPFFCKQGNLNSSSMT